MPASENPSQVARAAREVLDALTTVAADTGDDATQVALDDALLAVQRRLSTLTGETS